MGQKLSCSISYYLKLKEPYQLEFLQPTISKIELCASSCNTNQKNLLERVTLIGFDEEGSTFLGQRLCERQNRRRSHDETIIDETANNVRCGAGENLHESSQWYKSPLDDASLFQNFYWLSIYYRIGLKLCRIQYVVGQLSVQGSIWEVGSLGHASLSIIGISFICNFIDKIVPLIRCSHKALFSDDHPAAY